MQVFLINLFVFIIVVAIGALGSIAWRLSKENRAVKELGMLQLSAHVNGLREMLASLRGADPHRYEVEFTDWGPDFLDMRYRWTIWDADRLLALKCNPDTKMGGIEIPFMLGNAGTRPMAEAEAMAWLDLQAINRFVVPSEPTVMRIEFNEGEKKLWVDGEETGAQLFVRNVIGEKPVVRLNGTEVKAKVYRDGVLFIDTSLPPLLKTTIPPLTTFGSTDSPLIIT